MWQLRYLTFIICLICTLRAVPAEANRVEDIPPPEVNRKNNAEECVWNILNLYWEGEFKETIGMDSLTNIQDECDEPYNEAKSDVTTEDWQTFLEAGTSRCFDRNCYKKRSNAEKNHCAEQCKSVWSKTPEQVPEGGWGLMPMVKQVWGSFNRYMGFGSLKKTAPVPPSPVWPAGGFRLGPR